MSNRLCKKCGERIPWHTRIDGKTKHLTSRKFCLICSPWGKHNTSTNDPIYRRSKKTTPYAQWPEKWKQTLTASNYRRSLKRKEELVQMSGGKCARCGYDRSIKALTFHHKVPENKVFCLDMATVAQHTWEAVLEEWKKCELLCRNCHAEIH